MQTNDQRSQEPFNIPSTCLSPGEDWSAKEALHLVIFEDKYNRPLKGGAPYHYYKPDRSKSASRRVNIYLSNTANDGSTDIRCDTIQCNAILVRFSHPGNYFKCSFSSIQNKDCNAFKTERSRACIQIKNSTEYPY